MDGRHENIAGRSVIVAASVLIGLFVAVPVGIARGTAIDSVPYFTMAAALVLLVAVFVAIAATISAILQGIDVSLSRKQEVIVMRHDISIHEESVPVSA